MSVGRANSGLDKPLHTTCRTVGLSAQPEMLRTECSDIRPLAGNHVVIESTETEGVFAFMAHVRCGSIMVRVGDLVHANQQVAEVGNSGSSMTPHLHFHLMSDRSPQNVQVIPFKFAASLKRHQLWKMPSGKSRN